ncbi:Phosphatidate cytidylyltransferase [Anaerohalosphaera lusitana]|uniref:Phosphatidate cytidylyltransferase n=1 Tax=Anaerohalosphaera lusitana TaxID=1936003 RepID=A0A1U9NKK2_9BACT|nr:phosphatidate cytidylyltransferase [Anaerohalosphaera lusitana]AQT68046.1 Phosphatidate cytidylyltransferase [Anaerohalosphaera lusitana]
MTEFINTNMHLLIAFAGIFLVLLIAGTTAAILKHRNPQKDYSNLQQRIKTWWYIAFFFAAALLLGKGFFVIFMAFVSFLAMKEYFSLIPTRRVDRRVLLWAYIAVPVQYCWIHIGWYGMFIIFIPVYMFLLTGLRLVLVGRTDGFLRSAGTIHWGMMATVFSLSHIAGLFLVTTPDHPQVSGQTLVFYLLFLTQINDVAQYIWGKSFGKRKVVPQISPGKTWAGLIGGVATTTVLAVLLAPYLTPMNLIHSIFAGIIIGLAGFFGDITISALKRDLKIKDSGSFLPGHGGILDRIDSLTFTAPLFLHFVRYFCT